MKYIKPLIFIFMAQLAGIIGSVFTFSSVEGWYTTLNQPFFTPPSFVFGPVWITLYTLMGIASFLVWQKNKSKTRTYALYFYALQLVLNALWSIIFFGFKNPQLAFYEILILFCTILVTTYYFYKVNKKASYLMIPYILWVFMATILNLAIWRLN